MKVLSYLQNRPQKTKAEMDANVDWCIKMLARVKRYDAEGMFRWHWVLIDSLEMFCDIKQHPYLGPKKALKWMEKNHPSAFVCYKNALDNLDEIIAIKFSIKIRSRIYENIQLNVVNERCVMELFVVIRNNQCVKITVQIVCSVRI